MCAPSESHSAASLSNPCPGAVLKGQMATLRPMTAAEAHGVALLIAGDPEASAWWGSNVSKIEGWLTQETTHPYRVMVDSQTAGIVEFSEENDPDYRYANIDIALLSPYVGRGIGPDVLRTLLGHLFGTLGHRRVTIDPMVHNTRAISAYAKVGFKPVGIMRLAERDPDGTWRDSLLMDILSGELE